MEIVRTRVAQLAAGLDLNSALPEDETVEKVCRIFRELRCGETIDRSQKVKGTSGVLSTAEAISLLCNSMALAGSFGSGKISDEDLAAALQGAIIKDEDKDAHPRAHNLHLGIQVRRGRQNHNIKTPL